FCSDLPERVRGTNLRLTNGIAMTDKHAGQAKGFWRELHLILRRTRQVWHLVPRRHRVALGGAALIMALTGASNTAVAVLPGKLIDEIKVAIDQGWTGEAMYHTAIRFLGLIAVVYTVREGLKVVQSYLVESTCTRMEKVMTVKVVAHLMKIDLGS